MFQLGLRGKSVIKKDVCLMDDPKKIKDPKAPSQKKMFIASTLGVISGAIIYTYFL